MFETKIASASQ